MDDNISYSAFDAFKPHFAALNIAGYYKIIRPMSYLHIVHFVVTSALMVLYNIQHIIKVVLVRHNVSQIVDILFILLTTLNTLGKQLAFNLKHRRLQKIYDVIRGPVFSPQNSSHVAFMKDNAVTMKRLLLFYYVCCACCGLLWSAFPFVNRFLGIDVEFTAYVPFDTSSSPTFEIVNMYLSLLITIQAYANMTMDCTIVAFYAQAKVQLQVLRYNLEHLVMSDDSQILTRTKNFGEERNIFKGVVNEDQVQGKFVRCVVHYRYILWFIKEIESIFAETLMIQFSVTAWVICMTVYKIVGLSLLSLEFVSMAMYLLCMLAQFFIYCYYGTQVKYESELVNVSLYCGDWLSLSPGFRRQILILMTKCSQPIKPRTAYVIPISLETYTSVLRASYTLFTFLDRK